MKRLFIAFLSCTPGFAAVFYNETFTGPDGSALSTHTSDSGATYSISTNATWAHDGIIYNNGLGTHTAYSHSPAILVANTDGASADMTATVVIKNNTALGSSLGVILRSESTGNNGYLCNYQPTVDNKFHIYRYAGGALVDEASASYSVAAGSSVTFVAQAQTVAGQVAVSISVGGSTIVSWTDPSPTSGLLNNKKVGLLLNLAASTSGTAGYNMVSVSVDDGATGALALTTTLASVTTTTATLSATASGGTAPYSYQWYRSGTAAFTPGAGNAVAGATNSTLADVPGSIGPWFYRVIVTDSAVPIPASGTGKQIGASLYKTAVNIVCIGDSITYGTGLSAGQDPCMQMGNTLNTWTQRSIAFSNQGVAGSKTADWQSGGANMNAAMTAGRAMSPAATVAVVMLGANDAAAPAHVSAATYGTNLGNIANYLVSQGYKVVLNYPTYIQSGANGGATDDLSTALLQQYLAQIDLLANGSAIVRGDSSAYASFMDHIYSASWYQADLTHPNSTGAAALGTAWAAAVARVLGFAGTGGRACPIAQ